MARRVRSSPSALGARLRPLLDRPRPAAARRALVRRAEWLGPLTVAALAGVLRFVDLGSPHALVFDEFHYARDAWSLIRQGYEGVWPEASVHELFADPQVVRLLPEPEFVAHPPLGKWVIALGELVFGLHPQGWRLMVAVLGTASVLMTARIGRRLFRSTLLGCTAGLLLSLDGLQFVMSRLALLDGVLGFFVLGAFGCLLVDLDRVRGRREVGTAGSAPAGRRFPRPWRLAAGALLGCACAVKWSGLYALLVFAALSFFWDRAVTRRVGPPASGRPTWRRDVATTVLALFGPALATYLAAWSGWFASDGGYDRHWADGRSGLSASQVPVLHLPLPQVPMTWMPSALRSWWHYHAEIYDFNVGFRLTHHYASHPWSWLAQSHPTLMRLVEFAPGQDGCTAAEGCVREVLALGNPALWWTACCALLHALWSVLRSRDHRAGAILTGVAATYLPWYLFPHRTLFSFYAVTLVPFLCLAVARFLHVAANPSGGSTGRRLVGRIAAGSLMLAVIGCFVYFHPLYTAEMIPVPAWRARMWLPGWV